MATAAKWFESVDDILGPRDRRFFSEGYKRVSCQLSGISISAFPDNTTRVSGKAEVVYPMDWSRKSSVRPLRPHLSSIDSLLLAIQLAEICLTHTYRLNSEQRRRMWLRRFSMRAGHLPQEELALFDVSASHRQVMPFSDTLCGHVSIFDCRIGTVKIRTEIEHVVPDKVTSLSGGAYPRAEDILGPPESRYYGSSYKLRNHTISNLTFTRRQRLEALAAVTDLGIEHQAYEGFGAYYEPSLSMIDCIAVMAQIGQILIYDQDDINRGQTNTLWMRKVAMESKTPYQPIGQPFVVSGSVVKSNLVHSGESSWRIAKMAGDCLGIHAETSLSHQLPAKIQTV